MTDDTSPKLPSPIRARRWSGPKTPPLRRRPYRVAIRLIGIPVLAVAGVFIYGGLRDRFVLPECDSDRAKKSLADLFKQLQLVPERYEPIKTVSSSKKEVVCSGNFPLSSGSSVGIDYTFYWQGYNANMRYGVTLHGAAK
jgi:hypothetical protein